MVVNRYYNQKNQRDNNDGAENEKRDNDRQDRLPNRNIMSPAEADSLDDQSQ